MTLSEILASVRRVETRTNRLVNDMMVGAYLSRFKGRGMDFEELREYMPGDDVRSIDWNVTNRMGRPFVKRFREERELTVVLAVDVSASSAFGSLRRTKREFAVEIAATLAISAARSSDKVALLLFTDKVELFVPPRKGRRHILRIIREMLTFEPKQRGTDIAAAMVFRREHKPKPAHSGSDSGTRPDQCAPRPGVPAPARPARKRTAQRRPPDRRGRGNGRSAGARHRARRRAREICAHQCGAAGGTGSCVQPGRGGDTAFQLSRGICAGLAALF